MNLKLTPAKALFGIATVLFLLALVQVKVSDLNLVTAGFAATAAGLFFSK